MLSIALSMPFTTDAMFPDTWRIVTAVSTRLGTASTRLAWRRRFRDSCFLRIAFAAYIRAPSVLPCGSAWRSRNKAGERAVEEHGRVGGGRGGGR